MRPRRVMRSRREVSRRTLTVLRPFFRYSYERGAWVLRVGGHKHGPVLIDGKSSTNRVAKPS